MRRDIVMGETSARLVGRAAIALARAHTEATLVVSAASFFATLGEVAWVELAAGADASRALRAEPSSAAPVVSPAFLRPSSLLSKGATGSAVLHPRPDARAPELRRAYRDGLRTLIVLSLVSSDGAPSRSVGQLVVALRRKAGAALSDVDVLAALSDVVSAAYAGCQTLARAGEVSRRAHVETRELRAAIERERSRPTVSARSARMRRLVDEIVPAVAAHDVTVLVLGESGVGKELVAQQIHACSRRGSRPMLAVNCGAIPATLVDSTLFGHERGAFTGATATHRGIFERAHCGTLFLDEVGELSLDVQAKLLRVLDKGEVERIGAVATSRVDVRVIAATNRDLSAMVSAGSFRLDLYHRLAIVPISVPPLRERLEDLDVLVPALLARIARRTGAPMIAATASQMRALRAKPWPGNVRELENVLARALLFAQRGKLAVDAALVDAPATGDAIVTFAESSRRCIEAALASSGGRIHGESGAAARLKLKPTTLQSKMQKLGIARRARRARRMVR